MTPPRQELRKPTKPIGYAVFGKDGSVRTVVEELPSNKEQIEEVVAQRFVEALRLGGRTLSDPHRPAEVFPDFTTVEEGNRIDLELGQIIDDELAAKLSTRQVYLAALNAAIESDLPLLSGLTITFHDGYQEALWPSLRSRPGQRLLNQMIQGFRREMPFLQDHQLNRVFIRTLCGDDGEPTASIYGHRIALAESSIPATFEMQRVGFPTRAERPAEVLAEKIEKKVRKNYAQTSQASVWLVLYALGDDAHTLSEPAARELARRILDKGGHHFDAVWAFDPRPGIGLDLAVQLWP